MPARSISTVVRAAACVCFLAADGIAQAPAVQAPDTEAKQEPAVPVEGAAPAPAQSPAPLPDSALDGDEPAPTPPREAPPTEAPAAEAEPVAPVAPTEPEQPESAPTESVPTEPTEPESTEPDAFPQGSLPSGVEKRAAPDYDGRPDEAQTFGDGALWVPRVLFFPLYVVSEYGIRAPLGALVTAAEKGNWLAVLSDFFTFDEQQKVGLVPTAYLEFDFEPSVGAYFFADDAFIDHNAVRIHGAMWPGDWWSLTVLDRISNASGTRRFALRAGLVVRPDYQFHGLGPDTLARDEVRYSGQEYDASAFFEAEPYRASDFRWELGVRRRVFDAESDFDHPSLARAIDDPNHPIDELPPGFAEGYSSMRSALLIALDTREPFPAPAHGLRVELRGEHAFDLEAPEGRRWVHYGGTATGFVDVLNQRIVSLSLDLELADPLAGEVPFSELVRLGGQGKMAGFQQDRLIDRSSATMLFEYRWPVWIWLDFAFHYALGNVFGQHLAGLTASRMRSSFGFGLKTARGDKPDHSLEFLLAFGTETIDQGHEIDTVRFAIGGRSGL